MKKVMRLAISMIMIVMMVASLAAVSYAQEPIVIVGNQPIEEVEKTGGLILCIPTQEQLEIYKNCKHEFDNIVLVKDPSCSEYGYRYQRCNKCGYIAGYPMERNAHSYGDWERIREPSCDKVGYEIAKCRVCGYTTAREIAKIPHKFGDWTITMEATDHSSGMRKRTCTVCGTVEEASYDPDGTLRKGVKGLAVRTMQEKLAEQGFMKAKDIDGEYGSKTAQAVKNFQTRIHLNADGIAWPQTLKLLDHKFTDWEITKDATYYEPGVMKRKCTECEYFEEKNVGELLQSGMQGDTVKQLQQRLNELGYKVGYPDGVYGDVTRRAINKYQSDHNLTEDGICWPGIWLELFNGSVDD